ncbi:MAG: histidine phosphatase family protein [Firmicutes bacterium]|nr:histidine phosphatase family protein [Bacillota bacterium]
MSINSKYPITTLCLVRHGESTWNAERRVQGQLDPPLSPLGRRQAELVAQRLKKEPWSVLYSSDLSRARQTAEVIAAQTGLSIQIEPLLRERSQGKREGLLLAEANELYPDIHAPEVGRENDEALQARAVKVYERIRNAHLGERVLIVAHGALMRSFLNTVVEPFDQLSIENTSCTMLHWDGENWACEYLADASHL